MVVPPSTVNVSRVWSWLSEFVPCVTLTGISLSPAYKQSEGLAYDRDATVAGEVLPLLIGA